MKDKQLQKLRRTWLSIMGLLVLCSLVACSFASQGAKQSQSEQSVSGSISEASTSENSSSSSSDNGQGDSVDIQSSSTIALVGTDRSPISNNAAWCAPLQICWDEMAVYFNDGAPLTNLSKVALADQLNDAHFSSELLSEDHYLSYAGPATHAAKSQIEQDLLAKFNEKSAILDSLNWADSELDAQTLLYAMLFRQFSFEHPFEILDKGDFGSSKGDNLSHNVKYFGSYDNDLLLAQVSPLYYEDNEHFACQIWTEEGDVVVLARGISGENFDELWTNLQMRTQAQDKPLETASFVCPNLKFSLLKEYKALCGASLGLTSGKTVEIGRALQTLELTLDNVGGKVKSEAAIMVETTAFIDEDETVSCDFIFDDDFTLFVADGATSNEFYPYLGLHIHNIEAFQSESGA